MDPMSIMSLAGILGGGGTKVSQSVSNTSYSAISANISGISNNPVTGAPSATQTPTSTASTTSSNGSGGGLLDSILGGGGDGAYYPTDTSTTAPADLVQPAGGVFGTQTALYLLAPIAALGVAVWFFWKRK